MSLKKCVFGVTAALVLSISCWALTRPAVQRVAPETLHPQRSIAYIHWDGSDAHAEAIQKTAQYKALFESGLADYIVDAATRFMPLLMQQAGPGVDPSQLDAIKSFAMGLYTDGVSISISDGQADGPPVPLGTVVFHGAGDKTDAVMQFVAGLAREEVVSSSIDGRDILTMIIPDTPGFELSMWSEGSHLVAAVGPQAAQHAIQIANGEAANVTASENWKKYHDGKADFTIASVSWLDFGALLEKFGQIPMPVPEVQPSPTINQLAEALGIDTLGAIGGQFGYRGEAVVVKTVVEAPAPRKGLLALIDQPIIGLSDLPPLPERSTTFFGFSLDTAKSWDTVLGTAESVLPLLPPEASEEFNEAVQALPQLLGFDLRADLLDPLGNVHCIYRDPAGGPLGFGFGAAFAIDDVKKVKATVERLLARLEAELRNAGTPMPIAVQRADADGRELYTVPAGAFAPTIGIGEDWMVVTLFPQAAKTFFMRQDGKLPSWTAGEDGERALAEMPKQFTSISYDDPRESLAMLYNFVPMINAAVHTAAPMVGGFNVRAADLPPQEVVLAPLFPNVIASGPTDDGLEQLARHSLPMMPVPSAEGAAVLPIMVALLLPAVQQAREAARRTQSKNNLKQIGLAMHNYHDVYRHFPQGTVPDTNLKPEQRLSFFYSILPFIEQAAPLQQPESQRKECVEQRRSSTA